MYKRYKLENNQDLVSLVKEYSNYGDEIIEANKRDIKKSLDEYINQQEHFPIPHQETLIPVHIMEHYENKVLLTDESVCAKMKSYKQISMQNGLLQQSFAGGLK